MKRLLFKQILFVIPIICGLSPSLLGQNIDYQDIFYGGVTGGGYSVCLGTGAGNFNVLIPPNSKIRKAFLFSYRIGKDAYNYTVTMNGLDYTFSDYNRISRINNNNGLSGNPDFSIHCLDITPDIDSSTTTYNIFFPTFSIPYMACVGCRYNSVFLIILFENVTLAKTNVALVYNNKDNDSTVNYLVSDLNPINNSGDIGLSIYSDHMTNIETFPWAGSYLILGTDTLGLLGGADSVNMSYSCGVKGHFYYQDSTLLGLDDDTEDSIMHKSDGLANIKSYLNNNATSVLITTQYQNPASSNMWTDFFLTWHLAYTTPCDTFTAGISSDTLMDFGDSTHLTAYGGYKYKWQPSFGLSCDTCANTIANPDSSTLYTCTIYNNDSCSKVYPVKVNIYNNVGVETMENDIKIKLYPNPAEDNIVIVHSSNKEAEYIITSIHGSELKNGILDEDETNLDVSELSPGIYFIMINGDGFNKSLKFVKN